MSLWRSLKPTTVCFKWSFSFKDSAVFRIIGSELQRREQLQWKSSLLDWGAHFLHRPAGKLKSVEIWRDFCTDSLMDRSNRNSCRSPGLKFSRVSVKLSICKNQFHQRRLLTDVCRQLRRRLQTHREPVSCIWNFKITDFPPVSLLHFMEPQATTCS